MNAIHQLGGQLAHAAAPQMRWFRRADTHKPRVVQLLGDIDDVVSDADNKDLRASAAAEFTWIRVWGTGHLDILDLQEQEDSLGDYRKDKLRLAATGTDDELRDANDEQPFQTDPKVTRIVFIVHGIRDLGRWASRFEPALRKRFAESGGQGRGGKLAVRSIRYGYFGMGQFLLVPNRQKHVRWFMDEYTETLARYPNVDTEIDFIGHSNGTYLLTSALEQYRSLKVDRVVLGGSVGRRDYDWKQRFSDHQVRAVRNYVARDDWVVACFLGSSSSGSSAPSAMTSVPRDSTASAPSIPRKARTQGIPSTTSDTSRDSTQPS